MLIKISCLLIVGVSLLFAAPSEISLSGTVKDAGGNAISGAKVYLASDTSKKVTTDNSGKFLIEVTNTTRPVNIHIQKSFDIAGHGSSLCFYINTAVSSGQVTIFAGNGRIVKKIELQNLSAGFQNVSLAGISNGFYILQLTIGDQTIRRRLIRAGSEVYVSNYQTREGEQSSSITMAKVAAVVDTLVTDKSGYSTQKTTIDSYKKSDIAIVLIDDNPIECKLPELPAASALTEHPKLPDPFTFYNGTKMTKKSEWACRRAEILQMAGKYVYGPYPPKPDSVWGTVEGGSIKVNCKVGSKTGNFTITANGSGSILYFNFSSQIAKPSGCREVNFKGTPYISIIKNLYSRNEVSAIIAGAWAIDRVIDVLEKNPGGGIDPKKVMVSGCSFAGKAALAAGAFVDRMALTVVVESGALGGSSWRQSEWFRHGSGNYGCNDGKPQGVDNLEDDNQETYNRPWFTSELRYFKNSPSKLKNLPFDQHMVIACIAPRPCLYITNANKDAWCHLGATCEALSAWAAEPVWNALGVSRNFGFNMAQGAYMHCSIGENAEHPKLVQEFYKLVFQGDTTAQTDVMGIKDKELYQPKADWQTMWVDWDMAPKLD